MVQEFNAGAIKRGMQTKLSAAKEQLKNNAEATMLDVYVKADFTDDEIWVLAHLKCNASRVNMEWEGFYVSDLQHDEFVKRRYNDLKTRIEARKTEKK